MPVIVTVPAPTPVTVPDADTVATDVALDDHVGATVALDPSLYEAVAVTIVVCPTSRLVAPALTDTPVTVAIGGVTVIPTDPLTPSKVAVIVVLPTATAVTVGTMPDSTVATPGLLDDQVGTASSVVPSL